MTHAGVDSVYGTVGKVAGGQCWHDTLCTLC